MRAGAQLRDQAAPCLLILLRRREGGAAAIDHGKLHFDAAEHQHPFGNSLGKFPDIGKQQTPLYGHVADDGLDRGDAIVERRLGIIEGIAVTTAHDGPVAHLIAAENQTRNPSRV